MSLPGRLDIQMEKLIFAPNIDWPIGSIKAQVEQATGLPVAVDNVANACALSEVWFGDSDGMHDLVAVNVSEGIGTGIFANGRLLRGEGGLAGEFGHVQMDPDGAALRLRQPRMLGDDRIEPRRSTLLRGVRAETAACPLMRC